MKYFTYLGALLIGLFLSSCNDYNYKDYDKGYDAAWGSDKKPNMFSSEEYSEGYNRGLIDLAMYEDGYYDGYNKKPAMYPKDFVYMEGFKDGSKKRRY